jgi:hypothetical protein
LRNSGAGEREGKQAQAQSDRERQGDTHRPTLLLRHDEVCDRVAQSALPFAMAPQKKDMKHMKNLKHMKKTSEFFFMAFMPLS